MKTKPKLNVKLLNQIKKHILVEPARINMREGLCSASTAVAAYDHAKKPACGTVGCIAGWAVILGTTAKDKLHPFKHMLSMKEWKERLCPYNKATIQWAAIEDKAHTLLRITSEYSKLFHPDYWPKEWSDKLHRERPGTATYAGVIADYIDFYISKDGAV